MSARPFIAVASAFLSLSSAHGDGAARKAELRIGAYPPGKRNQITDVAGVMVGHVTLQSGKGALKKGAGPVRTGVTVVVPAPGDLWKSAVFAGTHVFNGVGEAAGFFALRENRLLQTPIGITNTLVLECDDSSLNDIHGRHVRAEHALAALKSASTSFAEGAVGAGTGMISYDFKSGIGSSSRIVEIADGKRKVKYVVGVLVNSNIGTQTRSVLRVLGAPIGSRITDLMPVERPRAQGSGSIVIVVATDAPMDPVQLSRLAQRATSGVLRTGTPGYNGSGDFTVAFSTANRVDPEKTLVDIRLLSDSALNSFFEAVADATEESVLNSLLNAATTDGRDGNVAYAFPKERLPQLLGPKMLGE